VAWPRPASYQERREDGYAEPELLLLIGTAHISKQSAKDVAHVIESVRPDCVMVELCRSRTAAMAEPMHNERNIPVSEVENQSSSQVAARPTNHNRSTDNLTSQHCTQATVSEGTQQQPVSGIHHSTQNNPQHVNQQQQEADIAAPANVLSLTGGLLIHLLSHPYIRTIIYPLHILGWWTLRWVCMGMYRLSNYKHETSLPVTGYLYLNKSYNY
jgi:hypothetical protein